jgi:hypothetical protein
MRRRPDARRRSFPGGTGRRPQGAGMSAVLPSSTTAGTSRAWLLWRALRPSTTISA